MSFPWQSLIVLLEFGMLRGRTCLLKTNLVHHTKYAQCISRGHKIEILCSHWNISPPNIPSYQALRQHALGDDQDLSQPFYKQWPYLNKAVLLDKLV